MQKKEYNKIKMFNKNQVIRYGYYRESDLKKEKVKKILIGINPFLKNIISSDPLFISIKGLAKLFIGDLVEMSKQIMFEKNDTLEWQIEPIEFFHLAQGLKRYFSLNDK